LQNRKSSGRDGQTPLSQECNSELLQSASCKLQTYQLWWWASNFQIHNALWKNLMNSEQIVEFLNASMIKHFLLLLDSLVLNLAKSLSSKTYRLNCLLNSTTIIRSVCPEKTKSFQIWEVFFQDWRMHFTNLSIPFPCVLAQMWDD
jgi:hypothetical protein